MRKSARDRDARRGYHAVIDGVNREIAAFKRDGYCPEEVIEGLKQCNHGIGQSDLWIVVEQLLVGHAIRQHGLLDTPKSKVVVNHVNNSLIPHQVMYNDRVRFGEICRPGPIDYFVVEVFKESEKSPRYMKEELLLYRIKLREERKLSVENENEALGRLLKQGGQNDKSNTG